MMICTSLQNYRAKVNFIIIRIKIEKEQKREGGISKIVFVNNWAQGRGAPVGATPPCWNFLNYLVVASKLHWQGNCNCFQNRYSYWWFLWYEDTQSKTKMKRVSSFEYFFLLRLLYNLIEVSRENSNLFFILFIPNFFNSLPRRVEPRHATCYSGALTTRPLSQLLYNENMKSWFCVLHLVKYIIRLGNRF